MYFLHWDICPKKIEAMTALYGKAPTHREKYRSNEYPLVSIKMATSEAEDHSNCDPTCSLLDEHMPRVMRALAAAPPSAAGGGPPPLPPLVLRAASTSGLGSSPSVPEDHSNCGRECSLLHSVKPTDPLFKELIGPALRNETLRFKEHVEKRLTALREAAAAAAAAAYDEEDAYDGYNDPPKPQPPHPPQPRTVADYIHQSHTIIHYLKTCGRFEEVEAGPVSMLEDPEHPDAVFFIHLRDPLDDDAVHDIYFFPNKTFVNCPNEFLHTVIQSWLDGCRVVVGDSLNCMEVRYALWPV
jgi:hypothetical protein